MAGRSASGGASKSNRKSGASKGATAKKPAPRTTRAAARRALATRDVSTRATGVATVRRRRAALVWELGALVGVAAGVLLLLSLLSYHPGDRLAGQWGVVDEQVRNWIGPLGAWISQFAVGAVGLTAFGVPPLLGLMGLSVWARRNRRPRIGESIGALGLVGSLSLIVQLVFPEVGFRGDELVGGGALGKALAVGVTGAVGTPGAWVVGITAALASIRLALGVRVLDLTRTVAGPTGWLARHAKGGLAGMTRDAWHGLRVRFEDWREERALRREERRWEREDRRAALEERQWDEEGDWELEPPVQRELPPTPRGVPAVVEVGATLMLEEAFARSAPRAAASVQSGPVGSASASLPPGAGVVPSASARVDRTAPASASATRSAEPAPPAPPSAAQRGKAQARLARLTGVASAPVEPAGEGAAPASEPATAAVDTMRGATARGVVHAEIRVGGPPREPSAPPAQGAMLRPEEPAAPPGSPPAAASAEPAALEAGSSSGSTDLDQRAAEAMRPRIQQVVRRSVDVNHVDRVVSARRWIRKDNKTYELPQLSLLVPPPDDASDVDEAELQAQAVRLEETLANYGVKGRVTNILPGPVVTMFEFEPAPGIKVSKIAGLGDDLAMALRAIKVRIVAPIPGKGAVGIEIPSKHRETVYFREVLAHKSFRKSKYALPLALGKGVDGGTVVADMAKFPHILVAGTTGSGKSVCVNSILLSLLYTKSPEEVRFILVDPKMLEFSIYDGIPHLLVPVVTSPKKAAVALRWAVEEMTRRYTVLASMGNRSIKNYNDRVEHLTAEWEAWEASCRAGKPIDKPDCGRAAGEDTVVFRSQGGDPIAPPDKMPYIVIIIDELADLMMVARKEVEESIVRLAQMARACGIHMLLATQRPSVDVITGLIKANFPSRLSFRVSSKVDSRTVLDANGAESLLGMGDGLFLPPGVSDLIRVHGCFVSDDEVNRVVAHLKEQGEPNYVDAVLVDPEGEDDEVLSEEEFDDMYDQAVAVVCEAGKASTSLLQRRLKLGYNRAARIIDCMERQGVVGPADGARPRDVLAQGFD